MNRFRSRPPRPGGGRVRAPFVLAVPALLAVAFLLMPLVGVLARTEWGQLGDHLSSPGVTEALKLSLVVSFWTLGLSLLLGVPLAWLLARVPFPGKALVRSLVLLPMVLPPTVGGVALLLGFGRRGLLGPWQEDTFGVVLPFHTSGAVVAATFVSMPFLVISLEGAIAGLRPSYEETAASLGASPARVFRTVTLPMVAPGLAAGAALTWARALGEFGATITFAGNLPGTTQTLPLQVYLLLQDSPEAATSVSLLLLAIAMAVLVALRGRWTGGGGPPGAVWTTGVSRGLWAGQRPVPMLMPYEGRLPVRRGGRAPVACVGRVSMRCAGRVAMLYGSRVPVAWAGRVPMPSGGRAPIPGGTVRSSMASPRCPSPAGAGRCTRTSPGSPGSSSTPNPAPPSPSSGPTAPARPPSCAPSSA